MLQLIDGSIRETLTVNTIESTGGSGINGVSGSYTVPAINNCTQLNSWPYITYWNSYPVICTDKTAKAIEILKKLQAEKVIDVTSVNRFIALIEEIAQIL